MSTTTDFIERFWDRDAATYDRSPTHAPHSSAERAAWAAALARLLPPPPAKVLDAGAGTGFVTLTLARLGYDVTALDLSQGMLDVLSRKAHELGLRVATTQGPADLPPTGPFDAAVERHLMWTLPDPKATLTAWRDVADRLVLLEGLTGGAAYLPDRLRQRGRALVSRFRRDPPAHHAEYASEVRARLPLAGGTTPERLVSLVEESGWGPARLVRLRDVEWASTRSLPAPDRLFGTHPRFAISADKTN